MLLICSLTALENWMTLRWCPPHSHRSRWSLWALSTFMKFLTMLKVCISQSVVYQSTPQLLAHIKKKGYNELNCLLLNIYIWILDVKCYATFSWLNGLVVKENSIYHNLIHNKIVPVLCYTTINVMLHFSDEQIMWMWEYGIIIQKYY